VKESGQITGSIGRTVSQNDKGTEKSADETEALKSGVLLGIKTPLGNDKNGLPRYVYKTLWISSSNRKIKPVMQTKDILLPRKSGFWKLQIQRAAFGRGSEDIIKAFGIDGSSDIKLEKQAAPINF
jgi:hypothetical protein